MYVLFGKVFFLFGAVFFAFGMLYFFIWGGVFRICCMVCLTTMARDGFSFDLTTNLNLFRRSHDALSVESETNTKTNLNTHKRINEDLEHVLLHKAKQKPQIIFHRIQNALRQPKHLKVGQKISGPLSTFHSRGKN